MKVKINFNKHDVWVGIRWRVAVATMAKPRPKFNYDPLVFEDKHFAELRVCLLPCLPITASWFTGGAT